MIIAVTSEQKPNMPTRSIYIRKADLPLWEALEAKTEKISQMLNLQFQPVLVINRPIKTDAIKSSPPVQVIEPSTVDAPIITPRNKDLEFCKHNAVKGLCKKGCR